MTRPGTCGAAGGAISLWVNAISCASGLSGIISTVSDPYLGGISVFCYDSRYHHDPWYVFLDQVSNL